MPHIILSGYYGFNNAGDEAILAALITGLQDRIDDVELTVLSSNPTWTKEVHQVKAIGRYNIKKLSSYFRSADLLISGGGSLLQDVTGYKTIPYYLGVMKLAQLFKTPVFCCGQGIGPLNNPLNRKLVKQVLNSVAAITVRDRASQKLLQEIGVKQEVKLTSDPVFLLRPAKTDRVNQILKQEEIEINKPTIGVAPRAWGDNSYLKELAKLLDLLKDKLQAQILFLPLDYPDDREVSLQVREMMSEEAMVIRANYTPQEVLALTERVDLMVGVRLHSLIFATVMGVLPAGISYDPKVDNFLERLSLAPVAKVDSLEVTKTYNRIVSLYEEKESFKSTLEKKSDNLAGLARQNLEITLRLLSDFND
ncbi:polysaccharide pyruvyl transferase CsaB [Halobacteroides halobius DSM 5150]|uniref:Polysaccharide pyruvyl transferase CsaB n=1 Tax=Halobacteroides halobius (strain ATCC 35273 / DSM 5150 / MD-1) TaxID=748449 RepID=L0KAQ7_HALHC|nr:polysaccharide pyruvyl transferase CsaB [Halobacteroides halobius]AGB42101.1 polysaccharide pyruvyl transferase CsaB [Halobacteroides halobius DSM 5150]